jgi:hypothetical protein
MPVLRSFLCAAIGLSLLFTQAEVALAADANPYWRGESNLPVETITGEWSTHGMTAKLTFEGRNLVGQDSRFEAGWVTPWISSDDELSETGNLDTVLSPTTAASLHELLRFRFRKEPWSQWFKSKLPYEEGLGMGGVGAWGGSSMTFFTRPRAIRYEWRLVGEIDGLATIKGDVELSIK